MIKLGSNCPLSGGNSLCTLFLCFISFKLLTEAHDAALLDLCFCSASQTMTNSQLVYCISNRAFSHNHMWNITTFSSHSFPATRLLTRIDLVGTTFPWTRLFSWAILLRGSILTAKSIQCEQREPAFSLVLQTVFYKLWLVKFAPWAGINIGHLKLFLLQILCFHFFSSLAGI